jgi:hypothetical protein
MERDLEAVIDDLVAHAAGTIEPTGEVVDDGLSDVLWRHRGDLGDIDFERLGDVVLGLLGEVNDHRSEFESPPSALAYAMAEMTTLTLKIAVGAASDAVRRDAARLAWRISCGWEAVLAGDIEDVTEHVVLESPDLLD